MINMKANLILRSIFLFLEICFIVVTIQLVNEHKWRSAQNPRQLQLAEQKFESVLQYTQKTRHFHYKEILVVTAKGKFIVKGPVLLQTKNGLGVVVDNQFAGPYVNDCNGNRLHNFFFSSSRDLQFFMNVDIIFPFDDEYPILVGKCKMLKEKNLGIKSFALVPFQVL